MTSFEWVNNQTPPSQISPAFILPEELRPGLSDVSPLDGIPVVDLNEPEIRLVEKISRACEEYGFFQVVNHGVADELCSRMMDVAKQPFEMPALEKAEFFSEDLGTEVRLYSRSLKVPGSSDGRVSMWSEAFFHPWHPTEDFTSILPSSAPQYRVVIAEYAKEVGKLLDRLLSLISLGLGLDKNFLKKWHGQNPRLRAQANYYPPCPSPELALGLAPHTDLNTLTILQQSGRVLGLQVIKDGKWVSVNPDPKSFVINVGDQLQVLSNSRYKSVHHRVVANKHELRVSLALFFGPDEETVIGPVEELIDEEHPPVYRNYKFAEFVKEFHRQDGTRRKVKEAFEVRQQK